MRNARSYKNPEKAEDELVLDELVDTDDEENNIEVAFIIPNDVGEDSDEGMEPEDDVSDEELELSEEDGDSDFTDSSENSNDADEAATSSSVKPNDNDTESNVNGKEAISDEEEEDDPTVRNMIAEIKKKRTTPPEIIIDDFITDICFHPQRDIIALATITGDVHVYQYDNKGNKLLRTIEVHAKACRDVEFTNDGVNLLTCSKDKSILITDVETEKLKKFYESAHENPINKLFVMDDNLFTTGDDNGVVKLWDLRTKHAVFELKEVEDYVTQMLTNDDKKLLLVTSGDGYLTTINIGARKLYVQSEPYEDELNCMGTFRNDSKVIVGTGKGRLYTYNWGQFGYHCDMFPGMKMPMSQMVPITDRIACVAGEEGVIRACHIMPHRNLGIVGQHSMPIEALDVNSTGELIASSSHNNDVRFWNVRYFEDFADPKPCEKPNAEKERQHNLPSSKYSNATDFFADLANEPEEND